MCVYVCACVHACVCESACERVCVDVASMHAYMSSVGNDHVRKFTHDTCTCVWPRGQNMKQKQFFSSCSNLLVCQSKEPLTLRCDCL